jgi:hypothetical protein
MLKKLTLAQVARMARATNAVVWDSLSLKEQREWVKRLNAERAAEADEDAKRKAHFAGVDRFMAQFYKPVSMKLLEEIADARRTHKQPAPKAKPKR